VRIDDSMTANIIIVVIKLAKCADNNVKKQRAGHG